MPEIARRLGRTARSVYQAAGALGLSKRRRAVIDAAWLDRLRRRHSSGWPDAEIAADLGCERHAVARWRHKLGLPANRLSPYCRVRVAMRTAAQCAAAGVRSLADVRVLAFRRRAAAAGWPVDLSPRAVQILDVLAARGPLTRPEICAAIAMPWHGSRKSLKGGRKLVGGTYLSDLMRRGLVVYLGRPGYGQGKGYGPGWYALALNVERAVDAGHGTE